MLVLNRLGEFAEYLTRYPRGNQPGEPFTIDVIVMPAKDVARLSTKC